MDISHEEDQRQEFRNILFDLSKSQLSLKDKLERSRIYQRLEKLYYSPSEGSGFRHFYSDIFLVLNQIELGDHPGSIDVLGQNLLEIRKGYQSLNLSEDGKPIDVSDNIRKLYDHVSLDIARMRYSDATKWQLTNGEEIEKIQSRVNQIESVIEKTERFQMQSKDDFERQHGELLKKVEKINKDIQSAQTAQQSVEEELSNQQREYIAILGIFAAVVLAFTGGIAFSTSVLNNIAQASIYRTIAVALIVGLVLINVLFGLFFYINLLVNKKDKIFPLVLSNIIIVSLLIFTIFAWYIGTVERRNDRINVTSPPQTSEPLETENDVNQQSTENKETTFH